MPLYGRQHRQCYDKITKKLNSLHGPKGCYSCSLYTYWHSSIHHHLNVNIIHLQLVFVIYTKQIYSLYLEHPDKDHISCMLWHFRIKDFTRLLAHIDFFHEILEASRAYMVEDNIFLVKWSLSFICIFLWLRKDTIVDHVVNWLRWNGRGRLCQYTNTWSNSWT